MVSLTRRQLTLSIVRYGTASWTSPTTWQSGPRLTKVAASDFYMNCGADGSRLCPRGASWAMPCWIAQTTLLHPCCRCCRGSIDRLSAPYEARLRRWYSPACPSSQTTDEAGGHGKRGGRKSTFCKAGTSCEARVSSKLWKIEPREPLAGRCSPIKIGPIPVVGPLHCIAIFQTLSMHEVAYPTRVFGGATVRSIAHRV